MRFSHRDLTRLADIVAAAAEREIMPRFRSLKSGDIRQKSSAIDLVTDADEAAEWFIRDETARAFPGTLFVGEESVARDPTLLTKMGLVDHVIVVDPVDGTGNFAWGLPLFGVIAAVIHKGETIAGLIYDPVGKDWLKVIRSEGAWAEEDGGSTTDLRVADSAPLSEMTGVTSWYLMSEPQRSAVAANLAKLKAAFAYRCAAYEYRLVAKGSVHFSLSYKLMPWDHAAGILLHAEAGGYSACLDGTPYSPTRHEGGVMSAPDKDSWQALKHALLE